MLQRFLGSPTWYARSCWESQLDIPRQSQRKEVGFLTLLLNAHRRILHLWFWMASVYYGVCVCVCACVCIISQHWLGRRSRRRPVCVIPRIINGCRCVRPHCSSQLQGLYSTQVCVCVYIILHLHMSLCAAIWGCLCLPRVLLGTLLAQEWLKW